MEPIMVLLIITIAAMLLDVFTGIAKALKHGNLDSSKMREGLWHKSGFIGLLALAELLQIASQYADLGFEVPALSLVCLFVIMTEAVSVIENLSDLNPAIANSPLGKLLENNKGE